MVVSLVSFFNTSNIGDLLISRSLMNTVEKYDDVRPFDYLGINEVRKEIYIGDKQTPENVPSKKLESTKKTLHKTIYRLRLEKIILYKHAYLSKMHIPEFEKSIKDSKALIIGGGNMIFDLMPSSLSAARFDYYVKTAKKYNKKVFAISIGIGPFQNDYQKKKAVQSLSKCDYITFRDEKSYNLFKNENPNYKNVSVVADPVFFSEFALDSHQKNDSIGINVINPNLFPNNHSYQETINNYAKLIDKLFDRTKQKVIIFNTENKDFQACKDVYAKCTAKNSISIKEVKSEDDLYDIYSQCKLIVGTRMHSLITAFSQNIPIVGLSWQQKVDAMFEIIEDTDSVFDLFKIDSNIEQIIDYCEYKLLHNNSEKSKDVMEKLKKKEEINHSILKTILK